MIAAICPACGSPGSEFDALCAACGTPLPSSPGVRTVPQAPAPAASLGADLPAGTVVSHFRITGLLGRGGMGVVYRAVDLELGRPVALKFLAPHALADEARLRREAQVAAALDHPNLGTLHEIGEHGGRRFLALALYEGETLQARLARDRALPPAEAAALAGQLAQGLAAAHRAGIVHRDLKPANVFLTSEGRVKLLDFGLARPAEGLDLTAAGIAVGTASYMAPERLLGEESGPPADVWAWGVVLYEMLAGQRPFGSRTADGRRGLVEAILAGEPPPLARLAPAAPPALLRMVDRCLVREPAGRPTMIELAAELSAGDPSSGSHALAPAPRRRGFWIAGGLAGLALAGALAFAYWRGHRPLPALAVVVAHPRVGGSADLAARALVAASVEAATLSTLAALEGVASFPAGSLAPAPETMTAEADCAPGLCRLTLRRLGGDGRVLWSEPLQLSPASLTLSAAAVAAAVRRAFAERRLVRPLPALQVSEAGYARYLELLQGLEGQRAPLAAVAAGLADLERREPGFVDAWLLDASLSVHLFERGRDPAELARGQAAAQRARELAPDDPRPVAALFDLALAADRLPEAELRLAELRRTSSSVSAVLLRQARLAERQGDRAGAIDRLAELAAAEPTWQHLLTLANHESRAGRLAAARVHLGVLLARFPGNRQGLLQLASLELMQGDAERGVTLFGDLAKRSPDLEALGNLGVALLLVRRYAEAETALRQALALAPDDPRVTLNLADALLLGGKSGAARALYRRIAERPAGPASGWEAESLRAQALAHLGEPGAAIAAVQAALTRVPDNPQASYEASLVYALVGDRASALVSAERAAAGGIEAGWFRLPWFDGLRGDPGFARRTALPRPRR